MKVLVTGAAGFIGSCLCENLLQNKIAVEGLDNFNDFYSPAIKDKSAAEVASCAKKHNMPFVMHNCDIRDFNKLDSVFENGGYDAVIHLAAYAGVRPSIENPALYYEVNVNGTLNILECMKKHGVKRLVFASSSSVYGNNKKVPFSEKDNVDRAISPYAATKKAGEVLCHTYYHLYGISTACLRLFTVYGRRQRPDLAIHKFTALISQGKPIPFFGDGSMKRDFTYIDDIIDGIVKALIWTGRETGYDIFNLGESKAISLTELVNLLSGALGKEAIINRLPVPPGDVKQTYADISHSKEVLGYNPVMDIKEGIAKFVEWYKSK
jgi:UDP-glucuronate 4-epimerase